MSKRLTIGGANPAAKKLGEYAEAAILDRGAIMSQDDKMTISGTLNKSFLLLGITTLTAVIAYTLTASGTIPQPMSMYGSLIAGLVVAFLIIFKPERAPSLSWVYAGLEGIALGSLSFFYASMLDGIVFKAVTLTIGTLGFMLFLYQHQIIKVTERFRSIIITATGGIMVMYLVVLVGNMFGANLTFLHQGGLLSIGISLFVVVIAAMNLLLDFDMIERGAEAGAPKYMEWYGGFSLLVTLVWLYMEMLRLVSLLSSNE